jgi:hypothetical protein
MLENKIHQEKTQVIKISVGRRVYFKDLLQKRKPSITGTI